MLNQSSVYSTDSSYLEWEVLQVVLQHKQRGDPNTVRTSYVDTRDDRLLLLTELVVQDVSHLDPLERVRAVHLTQVQLAHDDGCKETFESIEI